MVKYAIILILSFLIFSPVSAENVSEISSGNTPQDIVEILDERISGILSSVQMSSRKALLYSSNASTANMPVQQQQEADSGGRWGWYLYGAIMLTVTTVAAMRTFGEEEERAELPGPPGRP